WPAPRQDDRASRFPSKECLCMTGASGDPIRRTHDPSDPESAPSWLEQLDSLRPGSHDDEAPEVATLRDRLSQDPDVARMRDRLERLDIAIASAMDDLAAPPGLADRLLTRLADDRASTVEPDPVVATIGTPDGTSAAEVPADEVTSP